MVPEGWELKSLGSVLQRVTKPLLVEPKRLYREIGIRSHGKGIFHKALVSGEDLGNKRVFEVVPECLVLNIVFAWEQAVARTTQAEAGMIASHRFPMYQPKSGQCDVDFLVQFFKSKRGKRLLELASPGGAGRNKTLGNEEFAKLLVLMPSRAEQRHIAGTLRVWDDTIDTTRRLIRNTKALKRAQIAQVLRGKRGWQKVCLGALATLNPANESVPTGALVSYLPMNAVSDDGRIIRFDEAHYERVASGHASFQNGDVLIAKITPCFENGKGTLIKGLPSPVGFGSTEFFVLRPRDEASSRFIFHVTQSVAFRTRGELNMQGSAGQKRVPVDYIRKYTFYIPRSSEERIRITKALDLADNLCGALNADLQLLQEQKRALMQQLLTGTYRVKLPRMA
jgi:type I restriction enzyme S subunit